MNLIHRHSGLDISLAITKNHECLQWQHKGIGMAGLVWALAIGTESRFYNFLNGIAVVEVDWHGIVGGMPVQSR